MAWSGGTFTRTNGSYTGATTWAQDEANSFDIESVRHDVHDQDLATGINSCINKAGQNSPTANINWGGYKITNLGAGASSGDAVNYGQLAALLPPGLIAPYGAGAAPTGWILCNGAAVSRSTYSALFSVIGTTFGAGDGSTTFNVPDMRQRFPLGQAASGTGSVFGGTGGSIDHTHTVPAHNHGMGLGADLNIALSGLHSHSEDDLFTTSTGSGATTSVTWRTSDSGATETKTIDSTGSAHTHANTDFAGRIGLVTGGVDGNSTMTSGPGNPPFLSLSYIIKT